MTSNLRSLLMIIMAGVLLSGSSALARKKSVRSPDDDANLDDGNGSAIITQVVDRLAQQIAVLPDGVFPVIPSDWSQARIASALKKIRLRPDEKRVRNRRSLMFDHDVKTQTLIVLHPFFMLYGLVPNSNSLSRDQMRDLDRKLLSEVASLWKASPAAADAFADATLKLFDRDVIFCRGEVKMSSAIEYHFIVNPAWLEGGVLVTSPQWAISPDAPSYQEMQETGINSELYRSVISRGLGDNGVMSVEKTPTEMKVNFKVTKISYQLDTGHGEFVDIDNKSHAIECHNVLLDSENAKARNRAPQTSDKKGKPGDKTSDKASDKAAKPSPTATPTPKPAPTATPTPNPEAAPNPEAVVPKPPAD